jgi:hypothetical protein
MMVLDGEGLRTEWAGADPVVERYAVSMPSRVPEPNGVKPTVNSDDGRAGLPLSHGVRL